MKQNKLLRKLLIKIYIIAYKQYRKSHSEVCFKILREFKTAELKIELEK